MRGTGPWVRGMGTWHYPFFTGPPIHLKENGPGLVHETMPLLVQVTSEWFLPTLALIGQTNSSNGP